jgi:hypothetical protein
LNAGRSAGLSAGLSPEKAEKERHEETAEDGENSERLFWHAITPIVRTRSAVPLAKEAEEQRQEEAGEDGKDPTVLRHTNSPPFDCVAKANTSRPPQLEETPKA